MTTTGVLTGSVGAEGDNDERDVKLVQRLLDDWLAREAGEPLSPDGSMEPRTLAVIRSFQAWSGLDPDGRIEPGDPTWTALAAYHLAGIRSGRVRAKNVAFVPLPSPRGRPLPEADWREAFDVYLRRLRERL
jgi:peptidoglycan hydrolase-like protein with peptidoglycan-binding domain